MTPSEKSELQRMVQEELGRLTLIGDKEISAHGRWPNFTIGFHPPRTMQQPFGGGSSVGEPPRLSFRAVTRKVSSTWKWGLWYGFLYDTFDNSCAPITITGLLSLDLTSGLLTIPTYPAQIGLDIVTDWTGASPVITSATVVTGTVGDMTLDVRVEYVSDGATPPTYRQTHARVVLATAVDNSGTPLLSYKTGDLTMWYTAATGFLSDGTTPQAVPCLYPF